MNRMLSSVLILAFFVGVVIGIAYLVVPPLLDRWLAK